jgi:adenosylcobinamide kinase/adenosylcobinamide-phosphate guanylyltransferase
MITLITGGARSGKSRLAQDTAIASGKRVLFVATAEAGDDEMRRRIQVHRQHRPAGWRTLEAPSGVGPAIGRELGDARLVIIDDITLLVSNVLGGFVSADGVHVDVARAEAAVTREIDGLLDCLTGTAADFLIVTNEVGLGIVPDNEVGRAYRDLLGTVNQRLAAVADQVLMLVSGLPLKLKP